MKLEQFQELAPKTVNDLTIQTAEQISPELRGQIVLAGHRANIGHMAMGMSGEVLSELMIASLKHDAPNTLEEATDAKWYIVVVAGWKGFKLDSARLAHHVISNPEKDTVFSPGLLINLTVGTLVDVLKRESCYGKAKYQGVEVTPAVYETLIYDALSAIDQLLVTEGLDPEKGYDIVIEKLHKVRYKNGYSDEAALNRDLESEKSVIEGRDGQES